MKNKGITLVALVVTIIIMLILAGVTLRITLGDNGLISQTKQATKEYEISTEKEAIGQSILSEQLKKEIGEGEFKYLGKELHDRNMDNSNIWDIIVENSDNTTYGDKWRYLEKGEEIENYGRLKNSWVVNYETGEIIPLEEDNYKELDYKSTLAVTDGLVLNLDSGNLGNKLESFGSKSTLYYYDEEKYPTIESRQSEFEKQKGKTVEEDTNGYDRQKSTNINDYIDKETNAFKFNGNNYIELYNENGYDFTNGLTYEFYGKIEGAKESITNWGNINLGLFSFWSGNYTGGSGVRFGYVNNNTLYYSFNGGVTVKDNRYGGWSETGAPWNQIPEVGDIKNKEIYVSIIINPKEKYSSNENDDITQSVYVNIIEGDEVKSKFESTWLSKDCFESLINYGKQLKYLQMGRMTIDSGGKWHYLKGLCFTTRIYNKALTEDEVKANFETTKTYHDYITEMNKK